MLVEDTPIEPSPILPADGAISLPTYMTGRCIEYEDRSRSKSLCLFYRLDAQQIIHQRMCHNQTECLACSCGEFSERIL